MGMRRQPDAGGDLPSLAVEVKTGGSAAHDALNTLGGEFLILVVESMSVGCQFRKDEVVRAEPTGVPTPNSGELTGRHGCQINANFALSFANHSKPSGGKAQD